jgi:hypothetical protein
MNHAKEYQNIQENSIKITRLRENVVATAQTKNNGKQELLYKQNGNIQTVLIEKKPSQL